MNLEVARVLERVSRSDVPDMPDRIIAATAMVLKVPVLSKDPNLLALKSIETIW